MVVELLAHATFQKPCDEQKQQHSAAHKDKHANSVIKEPGNNIVYGIHAVAFLLWYLECISTVKYILRCAARVRSREGKQRLQIDAQ